MNTLKEYHRKELELESLHKKNADLMVGLELSNKKNASLMVKNSALSMKCEDFRRKNRWITDNRDNLKAKHKGKVRTVAELLVDGFLTINDQEVADKLFVDIAYIKNMKATIKRERK
jgi:hypothetical protein